MSSLLLMSPRSKWESSGEYCDVSVAALLGLSCSSTSVKRAAGTYLSPQVTGGIWNVKVSEWLNGVGGPKLITHIQHCLWTCV